MSKIALIAKLTAQDGKADEFEAALQHMIVAAEEETGLEIYSVHRVDDEPGVYYFFELYTDGDAFAVHGKGDGMKAAMGAVGGLLAARPEIIKATPVAAKGMAV